MSARRCCWCDRPALAKVKGGAYKSIKDHDLCRQCFERQLARATARRIPPARPRGPQVPMPELLD
jgi:hypothetical protein